MGSLYAMVKLLQSLLGGRMAKAVKKTANADLPGPWKPLTPYLAMLIGAGITVFVQSSSVFPSTLTPLVGLDLLTLERMFPLSLGSNVGTTVTGLLAALASKGATVERRHAFQVAFAHLFFNLSGIILWFPIPKMRVVPLACARFLRKTTARYRWFALLYVICVFFLIPLLIFGLSLAGWEVLVGVFVPVVILLLLVFVINVLQHYAPERFPTVLQTWDWLPLALRSLEPYDDPISRAKGFCWRGRRGHAKLIHDDDKT